MRRSRVFVVIASAVVAVGSLIAPGAAPSAVAAVPSPPVTLCVNLLGGVTYSSTGSCGLLQSRLTVASDTGVSGLATQVQSVEAALSTVNRRAFVDDFLHPRVLMLQDVNGNVSYYGWGLKPNNTYAIFTGAFACPTTTTAGGTFAPNTCNTEAALQLSAPRPQVYDMSVDGFGADAGGTSTIFNGYGIEIDQWGYTALTDPAQSQGSSNHPEMWASTAAITAGSGSTTATNLCVNKTGKAVSLAPASGLCKSNQTLLKVGSAPDLSTLAIRANTAETSVQALTKHSSAQSLADPRVLAIVDQAHGASFYGWGLLPNHAYGFRTTAGGYCSQTTNAAGRFAANNQVNCGSGPLHTGNAEADVFDQTPGVGASGPTHLFNAMHSEIDQHVVDYTALWTSNTHSSVYPQLWVTPPAVTPAGSTTHPIRLCANNATKVLGATRSNGTCTANQTPVALPADTDLTTLNSRVSAADTATTTLMNNAIAQEYLYPRLILIVDGNDNVSWYGFGVRTGGFYETALFCAGGQEGSYYSTNGEPGVILGNQTQCALQPLQGWPRAQSFDFQQELDCDNHLPTCQFVTDSAGNYPVIHYFNDYGIEITDALSDGVAHPEFGSSLHFELWFQR
jgi:hypothetical protein